jgi:hypothetical protein
MAELAPFGKESKPALTGIWLQLRAPLAVPGRVVVDGKEAVREGLGDGRRWIYWS